MWGEIRVDSVVTSYRALASAPTISPISLGPVALCRRVIRQQETRSIIATGAWASNAWYRYRGISASLHDVSGVCRCKEKVNVKHGIDQAPSIAIHTKRSSQISLYQLMTVCRRELKPIPRQYSSERDYQWQIKVLSKSPSLK